VLTVDVEDWNQLLDRRVGIRRSPNSAFKGQMQALLGAFDDLGATATFFVLGCTAADHPDVVADISGRGHEIACHGYSHIPVYRQAPAEFRADVERSVQVIEQITSIRPQGFRAPIFSINRDCMWAYEQLAELGFKYDASRCACPWVPNPINPAAEEPYRLQLSGGRELWELPVAARRVGTHSVPVGGASYWRFLPAGLHLRLLRKAEQRGAYPVLYVHPYECDPESLRANLPWWATRAELRLARQRECWRNFRREAVLTRLQAIGERFELTTCSAALEALTSTEQAAGERPARAAPARVVLAA